MEIVKKHLNNLQFYPDAQSKAMIFWHHTAGTSAEGALSWWNQTPDKVGTAYVIERDGTIIEAFDPIKWAYHLGVKGDDDFIEKHSVNIELVAVGQVYQEGAEFAFYPLYPNKTGRKVIPATDVVTLEKPWRGFTHYQKYSDKQIESLIWLTKKLMADFKIPLQANFKNFFEFNKDVIDAKIHTPGIWGHTTVRQDKNDVVPYTEFLNKVYNALQGNTFEAPKPITEVPKAVPSPSTSDNTYRGKRR